MPNLNDDARDAARPANADEAHQTPFSNCRFQICDLPGQCRGEGKCHHPAVPAATQSAVVLDGERVAKFICEIAEQTPEAPDYWSTCGQCQRNAGNAQDILADARAASPQATATQLRDALEHITQTAKRSREQSRRLRWIEIRAQCALDGTDDWRNIDLPKNGERVRRRLEARIAELERDKADEA